MSNYNNIIIEKYNIFIIWFIYEFELNSIVDNIELVPKSI